MKSNLILILLLLFVMQAHTQGVAVNNQAKAADASAAFDVSATNKGVLIPRLSTVERNAIVQPATALLLFNKDVQQFQVNIGTPASPNWQNIISLSSQEPSKDVWTTAGNKGLADTAFIGNTDARPLVFKTGDMVRLYLDSVHTKVGIGTSNPRTSLDIMAKDAMIVPVGTTAERPATPVVGMIRFNASTNKLEGYTTTGWVALH